MMKLSCLTYEEVVKVADILQKRILERFCPLRNGSCMKDCIAFKKAIFSQDAKDASWFLKVVPECGCFNVLSLDLVEI